MTLVPKPSKMLTLRLRSEISRCCNSRSFCGTFVEPTDRAALKSFTLVAAGIAIAVLNATPVFAQQADPVTGAAPASRQITVQRLTPPQPPADPPFVSGAVDDPDLLGNPSIDIPIDPPDPSDPPGPGNPPPPPPPPTGTVVRSVTRSWDWSGGNQDYVAVRVGARLTVTGTRRGPNETNPSVVTGSKVNGNAYLRGVFQNNDLDLLRITGNVSAPQFGAGNADFRVYLMGNQVYHLPVSASSYTYSDTRSWSYSPRVSYRFWVGPVPCSGSVGANINAGVQYSVGLYPARATAQIRPFVNSRGYIEAGLDLAVTGVQVGANLTFVNLNTNLQGTATLGFNGQQYVDLSYYGDYGLQTLSGSLYVRAWFAWWDTTWGIVNWNGYSYNGVLFNGSERQYL